jgi:hypothetical protein
MGILALPTYLYEIPAGACLEYLILHVSADLRRPQERQF